ncbi:DUF4186 domain-containing protein [Erwinia sp. V71]|uniref:DUF4186 domain-containing protein n=1 Tax=Erwinia sp. V71 TaxID=3369424 RepID=UPI003F5EB0E9
MTTFEALFSRLARSPFRQRFHLTLKDRDYCFNKGKTLIASHAADFIAQRLAPAHPPNDGKQTPMRGHPVFIAQHATATCCRGCLEKWHHIEAGQPLNAQQQRYVVEVLLYWLEKEVMK